MAAVMFDIRKYLVGETGISPVMGSGPALSTSM
jgi:hypothetical protein